MPPKRDEAEDNWHGIEDPKKRKQIQDRLAQRARRKRLAAKSQTANTTVDRHVNANQQATPQEHTTDGQLVHAPAIRDFHTVVPLSSSPAGDNPLAVAAGESSKNPYSFLPSMVELGLTEHHLISFPANTVHTALLKNGQLLGLVCSACVPAKSSPSTATTPWSLRPSKTQLETIHHTWIDRFPFVRFRDNFIRYSAYINEEEFVSDLFTIPSFKLKPNRACWDPEAWHICKEFCSKWGIFFFWPAED